MRGAWAPDVSPRRSWDGPPGEPATLVLGHDEQPELVRGAGHEGTRPRGSRRDHRALAAWVSVLVMAVVASRLLFFARPPSRDEAGYLLVASQLGPGRSLYGVRRVREIA